MFYNLTKFVKNEFYMERFHGNGLKKPEFRRYFRNNPTTKEIRAGGWHKESFLKIWAQSDQKSIF